MLASVADCAVRRDLTQDEENRLAALLADADAYIKVAIGQDIEQASETISINGNGRRRLQLPQVPVTAVSAVSLDGTALTNETHYQWDADGGLWRVSYAWPHTTQTLSVTYTHGYATVPAALKALCCRLALSMLDGASSSTDIKSETIDGYAVTYGTTEGASAFPPLDEVVLQRYRPMVAP